MTRPVSIVTAVLLLAASGCGSGDHSQARPTGPSKVVPRQAQQLTDLRDVRQLQSLFNTRSAEPRLILLVSPT